MKGSTEDYNAVLFNSSSLPPGLHYLELINRSKNDLQPILALNRVGSLQRLYVLSWLTGPARS